MEFIIPYIPTHNLKMCQEISFNSHIILSLLVVALVLKKEDKERSQVENVGRQKNVRYKVGDKLRNCIISYEIELL